MYLTPGALQNDPPPKSKYIHITRNTAFYAGIQSEDDDDKYILRQSKIGDPDSCPARYFERIEDEIVGISSTVDSLIVFGKEKIFRVQGLLGGGNLSYQVSTISDNAGCLSHNSIIRVNKSIYWCGRDGLYATDGTKVSKLPNSVRIAKSYNEWKDSFDNTSDIWGAYDDKQNRLFWTMAGENGERFLLCIELNYVEENHLPVSYTHLTLPTILLV